MEHLIDRLGIEAPRKESGFLELDPAVAEWRNYFSNEPIDRLDRQVFKEASVETDRSIQTSQDIEQAHRKNIHMLIEHIPFNKLEKLFELFAVRNGNHDNRVELYAKIEL